MKLTEYIKEHHYNNQSRFAVSQGTTPQQVTQWINKNFIVVNGFLYSPRRELKGDERCFKHNKQNDLIVDEINKLEVK